jgi:hypothetical protein
MIRINLELGIDARRMMQQVQLENKHLEEQISKGIELALNDLAEGDNFIEHVREQTKLELANIVNRAIMSFDVRHAVTKAINEKMAKKMEEYAEQISEQMIKKLI